MKNKIIKGLIIFITFFSVWSCTKKTTLVASLDPVANPAYIKFANYSTNFRQIVNNRDSFNIFVNNDKLNGSFFTYGSFFPTVTNLYAAVPAGPTTIRLTTNGVNTTDSVTWLLLLKI